MTAFELGRTYTVYQSTRQMCDMDMANVMTSMTSAAPVYRPPTYVSNLSPRCNGVMSFDDVASTAAAAAAAAVIGAGSRGGNGYSVPVSMAMLQSSSAVGERRERVLLRPWLENLINSGSVPGLEWIDEIKTTFKVPWKHRSKKNWSLLHSCVFLEWAKNTGRWVDGDPEPNYAQLKTRLRCAFNKAPDIQEMKVLHMMKCDEPYKVYRFTARRDGKSRPFARTFVTRASIPIATRKRRRRFNLPATSGLQPVNIKYEPETTSCHFAETLPVEKPPSEDGQYYCSKFAWTLSEQVSRSDVSPGKRHAAQLMLETNSICDEDTKPVFTSISSQPQPRRRILPEADDDDFDFFRLSTSATQFRLPTVTAALAVVGVRDGIVIPRSHALQTDFINENQGYTRKNGMGAHELMNNLKNNSEMLSCIPQRSLSVTVPTVSTTIGSSEPTIGDLYDDHLMQKPSSSVSPEQSRWASLQSPVSSDPSENFQPCDDSPSPVKPDLPLGRVNTSIVSAPRHLHFKKAILQSQQLLEQQRQHRDDNEICKMNIKNTEVNEECVQKLFATEKNPAQIIAHPDLSLPTPVARALPVVAITQSIASLNFGRQSGHGNVREQQPVVDSRYTKKDNNALSIQSNSSSSHYRTISDIQRMQEEQPWLHRDRHFQGLEAGRNVYEMNSSSTEQLPPKPCLMYSSIRRPSASADQELPSLNYSRDLQEVDFMEESNRHTSLKAPVTYDAESYFDNISCSPETTMCYNGTRQRVLPDAVDLTYGTQPTIDRCDCTDVIDLSLRNDRRHHMSSTEYQMSATKMFDFDHESKCEVTDPSVCTSDMNQMEARLRHETEAIANKSALLCSRERQLLALEQELAAREEALAYRHRHLSTSPEFSDSTTQVSSNVRMLPYTDSTSHCHLPNPASFSYHSSHFEASKYISNEQYRCAESNPGNENDNDILKAKRARMEYPYDSSTARTVMSQHTFSAQRAYETSGDQGPVIIYRRVSSTGSDNIPSPTALTPTSNEIDWNNTSWSKHSALSPSQLEGLLMTRKRGRPRGSRNRSKFEAVLVKRAAMMSSPPMSNNCHWANNSGVVHEPTAYDNFVVVGNNEGPQIRTTAPKFRSVSSYYDDRATVPVDSTGRRSPLYANQHAISPERHTIRAAEMPPSTKGGVSASMPATVRQLVKSAAGTTGASILPPLSPCLDSDKNSYTPQETSHLPRSFQGSSSAHHMQNNTTNTLEMAKGAGHENYHSINSSANTINSLNQLHTKYFYDNSFSKPHDVAGSERCMTHFTSVNSMTSKQWSDQDSSVHQENTNGWREEPSTRPGDAERKVVHHVSYGGCETMVLPGPNFRSDDCPRTWEFESGDISLNTHKLASNDYMSGCGRLVIDVEAE